MKALSGIHSVRKGGIKRGPITWCCYLMTGFFMYLLAIQGNIIPFLRSELHLSYGAVILHSECVRRARICHRHVRRLAYPSIRSSPGPLAWCIRYVGGGGLALRRFSGVV